MIYKNITDIKANPKNPRVIKDDKFAKLVQSIKDFPEMLEKRPLVCFTDTDKKLIVLGGNMRLKAAKEVGLKELPVLLAYDWTEEQKAQFLIKDNVGFGEWNWDELKEDWNVEQLADWGLDLPEFATEEVLAAEEDDFEVPADGIQTDIVLGDLFEIGEHRLLCGDSTDSDQVAKLMNGQKADISFTSPPYNAGTNVRGKFYENDNDDKTNDDYVKFLYDFTINTLNNSTYSFVNLQILESNKHALIDYQYQLKHQLKDILIWNKKQYPPHINKGTFGCKWEYVFAFCYESKSRSFPASWQGKFPNVIETENASGNEFGKIHKATFPIAFPSWILEKMDFAQSVLDLFCGTGTTMVASHQLKRKCYGMELDPKYCQVIIDRMKKLDPTLIIKKNGHAI
jgi:DNA modification methylase